MSNGEKKALALSQLLSSAAMLARRERGFPATKEIYVRVLLSAGAELPVYRWGILGRRLY